MNKQNKKGNLGIIFGIMAAFSGVVTLEQKEYLLVKRTGKALLSDEQQQEKIIAAQEKRDKRNAK